MPIPVISVAQMREWEKATWASGQTEAAVMQRAGKAVARKAEELTEPRAFILVLAGKGHNGTDAKYAADAISDRRVELLEVLEPDAARKRLRSFLAQGPALIIDGLFGVGLNRPLSPSWTDFIREVNQSTVRILAVDVPSGLNADTGLPMDDAIRASCTLTVGAVKEGLLKSHAWPFVGRLETAPDIGLIPYSFTSQIWFTSVADFKNFPPPRPISGHKGTFGHVMILAGSLGYHGAAVLAARGAQRAQPGLITVVTHEAVYQPIAAQCQAVMVRPWRDDRAAPATCTAILAGPGLAASDVPDELRRAVRKLWQESPLAMIVDASALEWLSPGAVPTNAIRVITPHPGEAARLLQTTPDTIQNNRQQAVRDLSNRYGDAWVVLKGHQTVIGRSQGQLFVNCSGNPLLAQGGSGDLLGGYIAGLLAQPALQQDPAKTLQYAVWQHGATADLLSARQPNWTVEDLARTLGYVS